MALTGTRSLEAWLIGRHYAPATIRLYVGYCRRAELACGNLDTAAADVLYDWWTTVPGSPSSRNGARKSLHAYYRAGGDDTGGPAAELPCWSEPAGDPDPVQDPVFDRLRAAAAGLGGVHQVAAVLLATTGCRITEARCARWEAFDLDGSRWRIVGKGSKRRGPKQRVVPLHESAVAVLAAWRHVCGSDVHVFPSRLVAGRPVTDCTMRNIVYRVSDAARVAHVNPHRWRHTFATAALNGTGDLAAVQDLLGHANPATTRRYTLVADTRLRQAVDAAVSGYGVLRAVG